MRPPSPQRTVLHAGQGYLALVWSWYVGPALTGRSCLFGQDLPPSQLDGSTPSRENNSAPQAFGQAGVAAVDWDRGWNVLPKGGQVEPHLWGKACAPPPQTPQMIRARSSSEQHRSGPRGPGPRARATPTRVRRP